MRSGVGRVPAVFVSTAHLGETGFCGTANARNDPDVMERCPIMVFSE
jgi:hypothetical protein